MCVPLARSSGAAWPATMAGSAAGAASATLAVALMHYSPRSTHQTNLPASVGGGGGGYSGGGGGRVGGGGGSFVHARGQKVHKSLGHAGHGEVLLVALGPEERKEDALASPTTAAGTSFAITKQEAQKEEFPPKALDDPSTPQAGVSIPLTTPKGPPTLESASSSDASRELWRSGANRAQLHHRLVPELSSGSGTKADFCFVEVDLSSSSPLYTREDLVRIQQMWNAIE